MADEIIIDVRKVILSFVKDWKWIAGSTIVVAILAVGSTFIGVPKYEATTLVAASPARYQANYDPRYTTTNPTLLSNLSYINLANSDEIIGNVYDEWRKTNDRDYRTEDFKTRIAIAAIEGDLISLTTISSDAENAARISNFWATEFIRTANKIYAGQDLDQLSYFEAQVVQADEAVKEAEQALENFQNTNLLDLYSNQLNSILAAQSEIYLHQRLIEQTRQEATGLLDQVENLSSNGPVSLSDQTAWNILRIRFYSSRIAVISNGDQDKFGDSVDIQFSNADSGQEILADEFLNAGISWIESLDQLSLQQQTLLEGYSSQIGELKSKIQALDNEQNKLNLELELANETYSTLFRKQEEITISFQDPNGKFIIAAGSVVPSEPKSRHTALTLAVAALTGFVVSILGVFIVRWWKRQ